MAPDGRHPGEPPGDTDPDHPETTTRRPPQAPTREPLRGERAPVRYLRHAADDPWWARASLLWPLYVALALGALVVANQLALALTGGPEPTPPAPWDRACVTQADTADCAQLWPAEAPTPGH